MNPEIASEVTEQQIDYMIQRALGLLMGDLRHWRNQLSTVNFGIATNVGRSSYKKPLVPQLILIFNLWCAARALINTLEYSQAVPKSWLTETKMVEQEKVSGHINWPVSFEHQYRGETGFAVQSMIRRTAESQIG